MAELYINFLETEKMNMFMSLDFCHSVKEHDFLLGEIIRL